MRSIKKEQARVGGWFRERRRSKMDKTEITCAEAAKAMIMIMREVGVSNGGVPCDTPCGPCSCGAWHSWSDMAGRIIDTIKR